MWIIIPIIVIIIALKYYYELPTVKGRIGEKRVNKVLIKCAEQFGGIELIDIMLEDNRSSSQIDNILLTQKALYVCEVKNYKGFIFGSDTQKNWTMTVKHTNTKKSRSGKRYRKTHISKHPFYNPILQNITHINKIKKLINAKPGLPIINIIVFGNNAKLKNVTTVNDIHVVNIKNLFKTIDTIEQTMTESIDLDNQIDIIESFHELNITDKTSRKAHVKRIKQKYS